MNAEIQEQMHAIRKRLAVFYKSYEINLWLRLPHQLLGGQRACDLINAGKAAEVERVLDQLESGSFV